MLRFNTLAQWLAWQEQLHPNAIDLGLERVAAVWQRLYSQTLPFTVITVAGTNGKGSTVAMLSAIYQAAGYRVAAYTSPHLLRYNERIVIAGEAVSDDALCAAFAAVDTARGDISLTYFEFGTLAALYLFSQQSLDIVVLEVGMGGRLDAVNIIEADVAIVTAIDLDHQEWLGGDRETIGREKAGIFRRDKFAIVSDPAMPDSVRTVAQWVGASLFSLRKEFDYCVEGAQWRWWSTQQQSVGLPRPALSGAHQFQNAAGVLMAIALLQPTHPVSQSQIREGLLTARVPGRFELIPGDITTVLDVAHNPAGARVLAAALRDMPKHTGNTLAVFTALADKDVAGIVLPLLPMIGGWYVAPAQSLRAITAESLRTTLVNVGCVAPVHALASLPQAYQLARDTAQAGDWIVVFGSFYAVAEVWYCAYNQPP
jgi:dihydrofolate synthase/folylpolyglutamate synthase